MIDSCKSIHTSCFSCQRSSARKLREATLCRHRSLGPPYSHNFLTNLNPPILQYGPKNWHTLYALTLSNIDRFANLFHCCYQENICNNTAAKDSTTLQVCRYTTL